MYIHAPTHTEDGTILYVMHNPVYPPVFVAVKHTKEQFQSILA